MNPDNIVPRLVMKHFFVTFMICFHVVTSFSQTVLNDPHWNLLWEDNFNYLDFSTWMVRNNFDQRLKEVLQSQ